MKKAVSANSKRVPGDAAFKKARQCADSKPPDLKKAARLLCKACEVGHGDATYALATWYLHGRYFNRNLSTALKLLRKAAAIGVASAAFDIAVCYEKGIGIKRREATAFIFYLRAALLGDAQAMYEVGRCYYFGIGVLKNRPVSREWISHSLKLGAEKSA